MTRKSGRGGIGILGSGQLALMLADAARRIGLEPLCWADRPGTPVERGGHAVATLANLVKECDVLIFENEFVDCAALASATEGTRARFLPPLPVIEEFQDKAHQKALLTRLGIPTAPFEILPNGAAAAQARAAELLNKWQGRGVLKWARLGYDGKGVRVLADAREAGEPTTRDFLEEGWKRGGRVYLEQHAEFTRELALVAAHCAGAALLTYPLVVSEQQHGICRKILGPAQALGVHPDQEAQVKTWARQLADDRGLEGVFALELFERSDGTLWINEIAPRVHNSGHYTQDACALDQFEAHCRIAAGQPVTFDPGCRAAFGMVNLLGPEGGTLPRDPGAPRPRDSAVKAHWYLKDSVSPRRKVGHLNLASDDPAGIAAVEALLESEALQWENEIRSQF